MTPTILGKPPAKKKNLDDYTTPIWNDERGRRLATIRMMNFMDQAALAAKLGVTQSVVCRIEQGKLRVPEKPFTVSDLKAIFPNHVSYILMGTNEESVNANFYRSRYWSEKLKRREKREV